jgi:UDP-N-acetylmuramoylalanine--D-glutamate ligase
MTAYTDKRVTVMGLGRFGGGVGVTRFLAARGAKVLVTDLDPADKLLKSVLQLSDLPGIAYRLGEHRIEDFTSADLVVVNPAVKPDNPYVSAARDAGVALTSEIRLLIEHLPDRRRTIGVTGTAGKSTTTAMIGHILRRHAAGRVHVGGNIGGSLLAQLDQIGGGRSGGTSGGDWVVLELSSFMLDNLRDAAWSPHIAVVTNVMPNHLDWHPTFEHYVAAKQVLLAFQRPEDHAILGHPIPRPGLSPRTTRIVDLDGIETWTRRPAMSLLLPGRHNAVNATLAIEACAIAGVTRDAAAAALADFPGLPHRLQFVCERNGVRYFNDSKSTTPEAAILAIESFTPGVVHAIVGGYDKHADLGAMASVAAQRCRAIYTIGATGDAIADAGEAERSAEVVRSGTLDRAVAETLTRVREGDVVLLSPGCASWDQFENFEQRGAAFVEAVLKYQGEGAPPAGAA